ncbi:MAG: CoA transferase [Chloroflexi bacterium]|nr:CoA transferase [Chloroflexota bacterium]
MARLPLHGLRVLDLTVVWAGPFATMLLGDLGAEVIRIETLHRPDTITRGPANPSPIVLEGARGSYYPDRDAGERPWNRSGYFNFAARHKHSMTVDLRRPEGLEVVKRLASVSDVVVDNNRFGTMRNLGISYESLREVRPDIIYLAAPAFGNTGPYAGVRGFGANTEAVVGHTWLRGYPDADPSMTYVIFHSDAAAGATAAFAVIAAVHHRDRTGEGQFIDLSQAENMMHHLAQPFMDYSINKRSQESLANRDETMAPQGVYACKGEDEWVAISIATDAQWAALAGIIGKPRLRNDIRFRTILSRKRNHEALDELLRDWTRDKGSYEIMATLQDARIAAGPVIGYRDAHYDPHLIDRGFFELVSEPQAGIHLHPSRGFRLSETPLHVRGPAPTMGQHNDAIYGALLGYSAAEVEEFRAQKHIGDVYVEIETGTGP